MIYCLWLYYAMCKISHDIGRLKMIRMPLLRLEDVNMILQCPITEGPSLYHVNLHRYISRLQSRLIIILFCMYTSKWIDKWNKNVILCISPIKSKYWGQVYRRLKSLDLLVDTDVIGIQENDQIHNLSYNLQPISLNTLFFPGKFVLLPVEQINSYIRVV